MALVRSSALSPELRLAQAISNFEAQLSIEQKAELSRYKPQNAPSIDDVMRLTAEIDRHSIGRIVEARRCYGPRMTNFLQGVQQFAKVADIAVGGSQVPAASGAWAVVRFLLLVRKGSSIAIVLALIIIQAGCQGTNPYVDKLSELFMTLGRTAPRYQEMAVLYPRSQHLQNALYEYYIVVIDMCCEIIKLSKSTIARYWTTFSQESYTQRLDRYASNIMNEVHLEMLVL
ncbi:MAG: hypothetical protein GOMPHAMPRED_000087 [Gomphillus americanus]|uniref:Uncharacterized protein n=1 Tax=Gomphillus americanus TaxID=1940652 RepID=A0A8H3E9W4_9LECA|nr:MAG: hypothetical protein GOMPHAMPRED_000087 [Gomphillus americanus]